jgi:hypothetical protein
MIPKKFKKNDFRPQTAEAIIKHARRIRNSTVKQHGY